MDVMTPPGRGSGAPHDGGRHHGEYKVPGGKLVVADFDVVDDALAHVSLSGDFFLEPDEALADINAALTGLPADSSAADSRPRWPRPCPKTRAVRFRADGRGGHRPPRPREGHRLGGPPLEIIGPSVLPIPRSVALDEVLDPRVGAGRRNPTLRFWDWRSPPW